MAPVGEDMEGQSAMRPAGAGPRVQSSHDILYAKMQGYQRVVRVADDRANAAETAMLHAKLESDAKVAQLTRERDAHKSQLRAATEALEAHERPDRGALERVQDLELKAHATRRALADMGADHPDFAAWADKARFDKAMAVRARHCLTHGCAETVKHVHLGTLGNAPVAAPVQSESEKALDDRLRAILNGERAYSKVITHTARAPRESSSTRCDRFVQAVSRDMGDAFERSRAAYAKAADPKVPEAPRV